jgi:lipoprotein-anchoring transpeptidase ErfK/SrfK
LLKRAALFLLFVAAGACTIGVAAPVASPPPAAIADGVTVDGVEVGGLTSEAARALVGHAAARPVVVEYAGRRWRATPKELHAATAVDGAVARALAAPEGSSVGRVVWAPRPAVRRWVDEIADTLDRPVKNARLVGLDEQGRPVVDAEQTGITVHRSATVASIVRRLRGGSRTVVPLAAARIEPWRTRAKIGPIVVIDRGANTLTLWEGRRRVRQFRVATGQAVYPTPSGTWKVVDKQLDPWWYPPTSSDWAKGLKPVPPGPGNPLGTRWMGLDAPAVGIHGTPDAASIGYSASHGCIRMNVPDAEWLFERVRIGTTVVIV